MPNPTRKRVLLVLPTHWDARQLAACRTAWADEIEVVPTEPDDASCPADFDPIGFVDRVVAGEFGRVDGVMSASDYPGAIVAAAISTRLGLGGSHPEAVIRTSHKYYSRVAQQAAAPEAVPRFALLDPRKPAAEQLPFGYPCFVKPVKGSFSVLARRIDDAAQLDALLCSAVVREYTEGYLRVFNRLVRSLSRLELDGRYFIAEELVSGALVTLEGFVTAQRFELLGIVDSTLHPGSSSFARFDYPSALPESVKERMTDIARRIVAELGLRQTLLNIELMWDRTSDRISVIEVNPRICGQFGDLYDKVDGTSGYEVALALCTGQEPRVRRGAGTHRVAASVPLRVFERCRVARAPDASDVAAAEAMFPDTLIWTECAEGEVLADFDGEDGSSHRYAVLNLGADDREALGARAAALAARLDFDLVRL